MSDAYDIDGVTVTPIGGGYYDLTHSSLTDPERVQGKEKAETRAAAISKAAAPPEGHMEQQGDLHGTTAAAAESIAAQAEEKGLIPAEEGKQSEADKSAEALTAAQGELKEAQARIAELEKAAQPLVQTVTVDEPPAPQVPASIPREYAGQMDAKQKAVFAKLGFEVHTIVLEENESIPPTGLFVQHNGRPYMIKPGEEVDVPSFLLDLLDDAVMSAPIVDGSTQKVLGYRDRSKYPYRRVTAKG